MNTYDKVAEAIREHIKYLKKHTDCIDFEYIVRFYQKYPYEEDWDLITTYVTIDYPSTAYEEIHFIDDFCEGQTDIKDIQVYSFGEISALIEHDGGNVYEIKEEN